MARIDVDSLRYADAKPKRFSQIELRDIAISILTLSFAFMIMFRNADFITVFFEHYMGSLWIVGMLVMMIAIVFLSFFVHEMGHKITAQNMGLWSEYRMFPMGLLLCIAVSFAGFLFAAPGVVYIKGYVTPEQDGRISLAGPATNIVLSVIGLGLMLALNGNPLVVFFYLLFVLNASLALFNLLPIGILDGSKIYRWNVQVWLVFFAMAVILFGVRILDILPTVYYSLG